MIDIYAHRGAHEHYPENSLPAFSQAVKMGAQGIELDVHLSQDKVPVVIHDETLDRTTGFAGRVRDLPLKTLTATFLLGPGQASIPSLEAVLDLLSSKRYSDRVNIEVKTDVYAYPGIEDRVHALCYAYPTLTYVLSSFNIASLARLRALASCDLALIAGQVNLIPWNQLQALDIQGLYLKGQPGLKDFMAAYPAFRYRLWTVNVLHRVRYWMEADIEILEALMTDRLSQVLAISQQKGEVWDD